MLDTSPLRLHAHLRRFVFGVAKVAQLECGPGAAGMPVQQRVLEFEIAVDDALAVAVVDCDDELLKEPSCLWLLYAFLFDNIVERVAAICVFHRHAQEPFGQKDFLQLHDVRV